MQVAAGIGGLADGAAAPPAHALDLEMDIEPGFEEYDGDGTAK